MIHLVYYDQHGAWHVLIWSGGVAKFRTYAEVCSFAWGQVMALATAAV